MSFLPEKDGQSEEEVGVGYPVFEEEPFQRRADEPLSKSELLV